MAGHYSDNDDTHNEPVQDYLDLLLAHATEKPEAQVDVAPAEAVSAEVTSVEAEQDQHASELGKPSELLSTNNIALFSARAGSRVAARSVAPGTFPVTASPVTAPPVTAPPVTNPPDSPSQSAPQSTPPTTSQPRSQPVRPTLKPYAEPVRPMPLRAPVMPSLKKTEPQAETETPVRSRTQVQAPPKPVEPELKARPAPVALEPTPVKPAPVIAPPIPEPPVPPVEKQAEIERVGAPQAEDEQPFATTEWLNGRPSWAQGRFECLLFSVGGLTLAVPLVELGTIYPMNEELTPIFGQADWFMGLLSVKDSNLKTVDTAKVVMPERYQPSMAEKYGFVISINGMSWGLAVDSVANAILLEPSDVKWRSERSKRPWLAGTVVEHMCALVDVSQLAAMFESAGKRKPRPGSQK